VRGVPVYVREQKRKEETIGGVPLTAVES
jgi:hypothetical protein